MQLQLQNALPPRTHGDLGRVGVQAERLSNAQPGVELHLFVVEPDDRAHRRRGAIVFAAGSVIGDLDRGYPFDRLASRNQKGFPVIDVQPLVSQGMKVNAQGILALVDHPPTEVDRAPGQGIHVFDDGSNPQDIGIHSHGSARLPVDPDG